MLCDNTKRMVIAGLLGIGIVQAAPAELGTPDWIVSYPGLGQAIGHGLTVSEDVIYVTGETCTPGGASDSFLLQYDVDGNLVWERTWGGSLAEIGLNVSAFANQVYVAGTTYTYAYDILGGREGDAVTLKYYNDGVLDLSNSADGWWTRFSGDAGYYGNDVAMGIANDESGNLYVAGYSEIGFVNQRAYVEKYNSAGVRQWHQHYGSSGTYRTAGAYGLVLSGNSLYVTGQACPDGTDRQVLVMKYGTDGTPVWTYFWGNAARPDIGSDLVVSGNDIYVTGYVCTSENPAGIDIVVLKLHDDGASASFVNSTYFAGPALDDSWGIVEVEGRIYVAGATDVGGHLDALLLVYDADLNLLENLSWGGAGNDRAFDIAVRDKKVYVTGVVDNQAFINAYDISYSTGDLNCDGTVNFSDINPFVLALTNWGAYLQEFPDCDIYLADIDGDGYVGFGDINPFVALLTSGG